MMCEHLRVAPKPVFQPSELLRLSMIGVYVAPNEVS